MTTRTVLAASETKQEIVLSTDKGIDRLWRFAPWLSRIVLLAATVVFARISVKYIGDPVRTAAAFEISLGSPAAITNMRVGFGAFPIGFAIITFSCLVSTSRHLTGLYFVMTIIGAATAARILGIVVDGPAIGKPQGSAAGSIHAHALYCRCLPRIGPSPVSGNKTSPRTSRRRRYGPEDRAGSKAR